MGCSSCGKRRTRPGEAQTAPHILGDVGDYPVHRVRVEQTGVVPGSGIGAIRYVKGSGVEEAILEGKLTVLALLPTSGYKTIQGVNGKLYCVGEGDNEVCYTDSAQAAQAAIELGVDVREQPVGVT